MASTNAAWGIELGAGELKALKLGRSGDGVELLEFVVIPHARVLSTPDFDQAEAQKTAARTLASQVDLTGASIAISVPGHSSFARFAKLPPVDPKKIKDIVKFEAVQQIPFPLEEVEWDYQTFKAPDSPDVEVGIFAMRRDQVMERLSLWNEANVTPDVITVSPVAAYNAVAYDLMFDDKTPGTVILDIGTTSTDLIVSEPGRAWIRTFPLGGHQFTEALVEAFKLSYVKAERLKREAEQSKHARHVFQAMRPVFGDMAQEVQRSIGYYQSLHRDANLTRLIGLGSTFQLPGLRKYLSQQLQMEVVRLDHFNRLKTEGARAAEFQAATLNMATAYGLALQGLGFDHGINANLMPLAVARDAMWRRKVKWFGLAAGLAVAAGGVNFIRPVMDEARVEGQVRPVVIDEAKNALKSARREWKDIEGGYKADFRGASALDLLERRDVFPYLVDDLGSMLADARAKAQSGEGSESAKAGFMFKLFNTRYIAGDASAEAASGETGEEPPSRSRSRRRRTAAADPTVIVTGETKPRIQVTLEVATTQADPDAFVRDTIQTWLDKNRDREGIPYTISKTVDLQLLGTEVIKDPKAATDKPEIGPGGDPAVGPDETVELETGRGGRGGRGRVGPDPGMAPPDTISPSPSGPSPFDNARIADMAPLPPDPPKGAPGEKITSYRVIFEAVLKEARKPEGKA